MIANTAKEMFQRGMRVKLSAEAYRCLLPRHNKHSTGTVMGYGRYAWLVRVKRDGIKATETYHVNFWEKE